ncbi:MAG: RcnB family protein [Sphingomonadales bacterium]
MRNLLMLALMAATAMPSIASAQPRAEIRHDRRVLQQERRDVREARRELRHDRRAYVAPYRGWRYRPVVVGYRLRPAFFGARYIIDPIPYRLHRPGRFQRWIRYGDDLLLVNVRTGRVIEVIPNRY